MPFELIVVEEFSAAHYIPDYPGDCRQVHGHNYRVEVAVTARELDQFGFVVDFRELKKVVRDVIRALDHENLNELKAFESLIPSAENIAFYLFNELKRRLPPGVKPVEVRVWETSRSAAIYREG